MQDQGFASFSPCCISHIAAIGGQFCFAGYKKPSSSNLFLLSTGSDAYKFLYLIFFCFNLGQQKILLNDCTLSQKLHISVFSFIYSSLSILPATIYILASFIPQWVILFLCQSESTSMMPSKLSV